MVAMKTRGEQLKRPEDAQVRPRRAPSTPPDSNGAFLLALADALRDILRDEHSAA